MAREKLLILGVLLCTCQVLAADDHPAPIHAAVDVPLVPPEFLAEANGNGGNGEEKDREHMKDNSFFIEEAYNQEQGVVQHIFNWIGFWQSNVHGREFNYNYTFEMPLSGEDHQLSLVFPWLQFVEEGDENGGLSDMLLNYRYQLFYDDEHGPTPAVAPRFSIILPTGDRTRGLGNGEAGFQFNLPVSKTTETFAYHFNAGYTYTAGVSLPLADGTFSPEHNLPGYNLGASIIWLTSYDFNLMLEWVALWDTEIDDLGFRDHSFQVILNPGFRWAVYTGDEIQWVLGAAVPIGLTDDTPDIGIFGYMSVEHRAKKEKKTCCD